nr:penton [Tawny frogmouth aviadenovirus A]
MYRGTTSTTTGLPPPPTVAPPAPPTSSLTPSVLPFFPTPGRMAAVNGLPMSIGSRGTAGEPTLLGPYFPNSGGELGDSSELYVPPQRVLAPTGGRNSIKYRDFAPQQNTTKLFYVDNKRSDLDVYNEEANHSNFRTTVIHNQDLDPETASTECIQLDNRSCWGGELRTCFRTNCPNVTSFFQSNTVRVRLMASRDPVTTDESERGYYDPKGAVYKWYDLTIPEGNYSLNEIIDLLNEGIVQLYLAEGRQNNVLRSDIGVKFDTRYLDLLRDPLTGMISSGTYVNKGYHPDIILLPGCAVDFTYSRLSLLLGISKREPYSKGFMITYEDLEGGHVPALLDLKSVENGSSSGGEVIDPNQALPLFRDPKGVSYNVITSRVRQPYTAYRSWLLAYKTPESWASAQTLLTVPDLSGGIGAMYTSMPDTFVPPTGFKEDAQSNNSAVVGMNLFPTVNKSVYVGAASYVQRLENSSLSAQAAFNRFPENEILKQAPPMNVLSVCDNQPITVQQGTLPLKNSLTGLQRVLVTDDQRRPIPYIYKTIATVQPRVLSSATLQ